MGARGSGVVAPDIADKECPDDAVAGIGEHQDDHAIDDDGECLEDSDAGSHDEAQLLCVLF